MKEMEEEIVKLYLSRVTCKETRDYKVVPVKRQETRAVLLQLDFHSLTKRMVQDLTKEKIGKEMILYLL